MASIPFILRGRLELPAENGPSPEHEFDRIRQIWLERASGMPVIVAVRGKNAGTPFGETTITETKEGTDNSEIASELGTPFGETTFTKTQEGADTTEASLMSSFGETTYTASQEGIDQGESPRPIPSYDKDADGVADSNRDRKEGAPSFVPPYSHF